MTACIGSAQATPYLLDFGSSPATVPQACADAHGAARACSTYGTLLQSYGDVVGHLDVTTHASRGGALQWFNTGFNDLYGVAFDNTPSVNAPEWVDLLPLDGSTLTLTHFDLGGYYNSMRRHVELDVLALGSDTPLFSYHGSIGSSGGSSGTGQHTAFDLNLSSATGLRIRWRDLDNAANTGIDNIAFQTDPVASQVPEPASWALFALGLAAGLARRKPRPASYGCRSGARR